MATRFFGSPLAWKIIGAFAAFQLALMKVIPGKKYTGTITPMGNLPDTGIMALLPTSLLLFCSLPAHLV